MPDRTDAASGSANEELSQSEKSQQQYETVNRGSIAHLFRLNISMPSPTE